MDRDPTQELLDVSPLNAIECKLARCHLSIENGDGNQVWQAVIRLFLGVDDALVPFFAAADDLVRHIEGIDVDAIDIRTSEMKMPSEGERCVDGRLRVNLGVASLDDR